MKKLEGYRTLQSEQRYGETMEETVLRYDSTKRTVTLGDTKEAEDVARISQAICDYLADQEEPVTEAVIDASVEGRRAMRKKALRQLVAEGKVTRHGKGGKADPFTYTLADTPHQQDAGFSGSVVPNIYQGTWEPESPNGVISSNDAADSGSQGSPKIEKSWEPENGLGDHNPERSAPSVPAFADFTASELWCDACKQAQQVNPEGETYHCTVCGAEVGTTTTTSCPVPSNDSLLEDAYDEGVI